LDDTKEKWVKVLQRGTFAANHSEEPLQLGFNAVQSRMTSPKTLDHTTSGIKHKIGSLADNPNLEKKGE